MALSAQLSLRWRLRLVTFAALGVIVAGCAFPEDSPDRGPPRLLDDGSRIVPPEGCARTGEEIGWDARFYNVGSSGEVILVLFAGDIERSRTRVTVQGDASSMHRLTWPPADFDSYPVEVRWSLSDRAFPVRLAGPEPVAYPCGLICPDERRDDRSCLH
jgi:hypothetical protein